MKQSLMVLAAAALLVGCATTGATFRSGVGDTFLSEAPWYAGAPAGGSIAHLPVMFQAGATQPASFDPSAADGTPLAGLLRDMTTYVDSARAGAPRIRTAPAGTPPDVHFGCELMPDDECESYDGRRMRLAVGRPSAEWIAAAADAAASAGAERVLVLTLEVGNYMPRQRGLTKKEIRLGTDYTLELPFLTALDKPVSVLQLTGVLVGRDGYAVRIGAEGLMARRTGIVMSGFGMQALIASEDVEQFRTLRRTDLPGQPLVWQVAIDNMLAQLTGITTHPTTEHDN